MDNAIEDANSFLTSAMDAHTHGEAAMADLFVQSAIAKALLAIAEEFERFNDRVENEIYNEQQRNAYG